MALVGLLEGAISRSNVIGCEINKYLLKHEIEKLKIALDSIEIPRWLPSIQNCSLENCFGKVQAYAYCYDEARYVPTDAHKVEKSTNKQVHLVVCFKCQKIYCPLENCFGEVQPYIFCNVEARYVTINGHKVKKLTKEQKHLTVCCDC